MSNPSLYMPLDRALRSIRLVEIQRDDTETLSCTLHQIPNLETCPPYTALSYAWGPEHPQHSIEVNGRQIYVRKNLWLALRALRKRMNEGNPTADSWKNARDRRDSHISYDNRNASTWKLFYIDALCINQDDDPEKSHQVNLMGPIFKKADLVISWLGEHGENSNAAYKWIMRRGPKTRHVQMTPRALQSWTLFKTFLNTPYWGRLWIVQEVLLARDAIVISRDETCDYEDLEFALARHYYEFQSLVQEEERHRYEVIRQLCLEMSRYVGLSFCTLVRTFCTQRCALPQDKVFALLGLEPAAVQDAPELLSADYSKSAEDVLRGFAQYIRKFEPFSGELMHIEMLHRLAHQMTLNPPCSKRMIASLYLEAPVSDAMIIKYQVDTLSPNQAWDKEQIELTWDSLTEPDLSLNFLAKETNFDRERMTLAAEELKRRQLLVEDNRRVAFKTLEEQRQQRVKAVAELGKQQLIFEDKRRDASEELEEQRRNSV